MTYGKISGSHYIVNSKFVVFTPSEFNKLVEFVRKYMHDFRIICDQSVKFALPLTTLVYTEFSVYFSNVRGIPILNM